jgi:hypothetical protein
VLLLIKGRLLNNSNQHEDMLIPVTTAARLAPSEVVRLILGGETSPSTGGRIAAQAVDAAGNALDATFPHRNHLSSDHDSTVAPDHSLKSWKQ